jgi:hypothetical protein
MVLHHHLRLSKQQNHPQVSLPRYREVQFGVMDGMAIALYPRHGDDCSNLLAKSILKRMIAWILILLTHRPLYQGAAFL